MSNAPYLTSLLGVALLVVCPAASAADSTPLLPLEKESRLVLLGGGLASRMARFGHFEAEVQNRHAGGRITVRNMADEGDTPGFRPRSSRPDPWAFPGADKSYTPRSGAKDRWGSGHVGNGNLPTPDGWLTRLEADAVVAFFGYTESFRGPAGLDAFSAELTNFINHTRAQRYNGSSSPKLVLVSPVAFENLSALHGTPDGVVENANLAIYTAAMEKVALQNNVPFVNLFAPSQRWYDQNREPLTRDGCNLTGPGYAVLAPFLADALFGSSKTTPTPSLLSAVREKNWMWHHYFKIPNGVHVYGRRHRPFGPVNYPAELVKLAEMTANRDAAIWAVLESKKFDLASADARTQTLPEIETNYRPSGKNGSTTYLYGDEALATFTVADGYAISMFASEKEFPHLANPVQMAFDNKGRLWVATMPTYPHYRPGDARPDDKLVILEDTDSDGRADKETIFASGLHLPTGFEFAPEGVYVAQGTHLVLLRDTDGDDHADVTETVLSGFDDHDTHHVISAFCTDPSGAIYMGEGTFLHSNIETAYGTVRSSNGGFFRFDPKRRHLERTTRLSIPNPWGTAVDRWGQMFFTDTSDPNTRWMLQGSVAVPYGSFTPVPPNLIEKAHRVRPTSGLEFVSSRHFPDDVQGDMLINNTIGFLGTKQHTLVDEGTGYVSNHRQDLLTSSDGNFRPVDMEFAPDGSLYLLDWHNVLVGHMQHSARDPLRDHLHGRVYRITHPGRPLVSRPKIHGATIAQLLDNLKLPEDRARYRTRRELRGRPSGQVLPALKAWTRDLDPADPAHEHHLLEALWVTWGLDRTDDSLLRRLLAADDPRARAAAVHVLRYSGHQLADQPALLAKTAADPHGRVRLETIAAASWLPADKALPIIGTAGQLEIDEWIKPVYETARTTLAGGTVATAAWTTPKTTLEGDAERLFMKGAEVYRREGHCITCHQEDGQGLPAAHFPPLAGTKWVQGDQDRLIKLTLHGLLGPIEVDGQTYPGLVPMTAFMGLSDEEVAAVLTYVRNSFGNGASVISPDRVKAVRAATSTQQGFINPAELLEQHPHP